MSPTISVQPAAKKKWHYLSGGVIWSVGWLAMCLLDSYLDLHNLAMLLVLTSALAAVCLPWRISVCAAIFFVLLFNWCFIPPRGTFTVDFHQHALMLLVLLVVNLIIIILMVMLRTQSENTSRHLIEADILRQWSDSLLESAVPREHLAELQHLLAQLSGREVALLVLKNELPMQDDLTKVWQLGDIGIEQRLSLWYSTRNNQQLGRGTGRYEMFFDVYLPLRARGHALGAVLIKNFEVHEFSTRIHLQAICDQFGSAVERYNSHQQEMNIRAQAQAQLVRNNLLAAISHDYRTPLATIMGAASSLDEQSAKLGTAQQHQLARRIFDEAERLNMMTNNILQLARLDANNHIVCDWQSAEEIIADLIRRWRGRNLDYRLHIQCQNVLPLLWCDAVLIGQLLENLVDNALKYSPIDAPVNISVTTQLNCVLFAVNDSGKGIDPRWYNKVFEPFQRGPVTAENTHVIGTGVGLALCRAIAIAHAGTITVNCPAEGGSCFELRLPLHNLPETIISANNSGAHG
jgi:two-component system, OmpR family, sensor histidine kinase KdpD